MSPYWPWPTIDFWPREVPTLKLAENTPPVAAFPLRTTLPLYQILAASLTRARRS